MTVIYYKNYKNTIFLHSTSIPLLCVLYIVGDKAMEILIGIFFIIIIFIIFIIFFFVLFKLLSKLLFFLFFRKQKIRIEKAIQERYNIAQQKKNSIVQNLEKLRDEIITVSSSEIPGKKIVKVIGVVSGISETQASTKDEFDLAEKEALYNMMLNAKNMGANAVIDIKPTTGSYEQQGSKWQVSQVIYMGTAVIVE